jgi:hypothetical protein
MANDNNNGSKTTAQPKPAERPKPERIDEGKTSGRPTPIKK